MVASVSLNHPEEETPVLPGVLPAAHLCSSVWVFELRYPRSVLLLWVSRLRGILRILYRVCVGKQKTNAIAPVLISTMSDSSIIG